MPLPRVFFRVNIQIYRPRFELGSQISLRNVCLFGFDSISTFIGYLMPNLFLFK